MGEIRRLRPAEKSNVGTMPEPKWGIPQRFVVLGLALILLAGVIMAVLGYMQYSDSQWFAAQVQRQRNAVLHLRPWAAIQIYRGLAATGIETTLEERLQGSREKMAVGMVIAAATGLFGAVFAAAGIVGLIRKKRQ